MRRERVRAREQPVPMPRLLLPRPPRRVRGVSAAPRVPQRVRPEPVHARDAHGLHCAGGVRELLFQDGENGPLQGMPRKPLLPVGDRRGVAERRPLTHTSVMSPDSSLMMFFRYWRPLIIRFLPRVFHSLISRCLPQLFLQAKLMNSSLLDTLP